MKKLSFSLSSKPSAAATAAATRTPQSFSDDAADSDSKPEYVTVFDSSKPLASSSHLVIPPIPNSFWTNRMKNVIPRPDSDEHSINSETHFVLDTSSAEAPSGSISYGLNVRVPKQKQDLQQLAALRRFQEDMKKLPEHGGMEDLTKLPAEKFAAAYLAGYGWKKGMGTGTRHEAADTKVVQFVGRRGREGIGYHPSSAVASKRKDGKHIHGRGREKGRYRREESRSRDEDREFTNKSDLAKGSNHGRKDREKESRGPLRWLKSQIRVRVISKDFKGGKWYLKKGEVVDVVSPTTCDILMDRSGELLQGVDQEILETAIPKRGGSVLILYGRHEGVYGSLEDWNAEKETGVVRDADSHVLINVRLEQIAEYVGDLS